MSAHADTSEHRPARDVVADTVRQWVDTDADLYQYVDKILNNLWRAKYRVVRRVGAGPATVPGATMFLALHMPGIDPTTSDPDEIADDVAALLNDGEFLSDATVTVSAIPAPQWLTPATLAALREAANRTQSEPRFVPCRAHAYEEVAAGRVRCRTCGIEALLAAPPSTDDPT